MHDYFSFCSKNRDLIFLPSALHVQIINQASKAEASVRRTLDSEIEAQALLTSVQPRTAQESTFHVQHVNQPSVRMHRSGSITVTANHDNKLFGSPSSRPNPSVEGTASASPSLMDLADLPISDYL